MNPSPGETTDAGAKFGSDALEASGAVRKLKKGRNENVSALFSCQLARRYRPFGVLERGDPGLADLQRHADSRIARAGKSKTFAERHRPAVELQMGA